jgi:membrane associated rhomboid family serine protease
MGGFRNYGPRFNLRGAFPRGIKTLIIACAVVFLGQTLVALFLGQDAYQRVNNYLGLMTVEVTHFGFVWQLFTYLFLHGGIMHLLLNMLFLWMFGKDLEMAWGTRKFYSYYFTCGVGAGLVEVIVKTILDPHATARMSSIPTIGASGAIYGVLIAAAIVFPDQQVWIIPFPITLPMKVYALIMVALEFYFSLSSGAGDSVSHVCHLGGALVGFLYLRRGSYFYGFRNKYSDWQRQRLKKKFEVYTREHQDKPPSRPDNWVN